MDSSEKPDWAEAGADVTNDQAATSTDTSVRGAPMRAAARVSIEHVDNRFAKAIEEPSPPDRFAHDLRVTAPRCCCPGPL